MEHAHQTASKTDRGISPGKLILLGIAVLILLLAAAAGSLWINQMSPATETEDAERAALRSKNLAELEAADTTTLTTYGWNDQAKGVVRIPIGKAMELVLPTLNTPASKQQP
jgi:flagellar basal body-associated protein FliL